MTLDWLARQGIKLERAGLSEFRIPGQQSYRPFTRRIPADFSSATFFLCAGVLDDNDVTVRTAESATITFPTFPDCMRNLGADIQTVE